MFSKQKQQTAAIYVRVSTEEQAKEGYSIPAQIEVLIQYCNLYNIRIYKTYKDLGISGKNVKSRPGLNELLDDSTKGLFDCIIVWKISRLSRNLKDLLILVDKLEQNNVAFISYSEKFDTSTPVGRMTLQILGSIAEFERNTLIENVKLGLNQKAKEGRWTGNHVYGYNNIDKQLKINPNESDIVKRIYQIYLNEGVGVFQIASLLNSEGYRTKRNALFGKDYIYRILTNPVYKGYVRHQIRTGEEYYEVKGIHDPIIDEEIFEEVQNKIKGRSRSFPKSNNEFLLSSILKCPQCGNGMVAKYGYYNNAKYRYYLCGNYHRHGASACNSNTLRADKIESFVIAKFESLVKNPNLITKTIKSVNEKSIIDTKPTENSINNIDAELQRLDNIREKYFKLYESDTLKPEQFASRLNEIQDQINTLTTRKIELTSNLKDKTIEINEEFIIYYLQQFVKLIPSLDRMDLKKLIYDFIKSINLNLDKTFKSMELQFPLGKGNLTIY